MAGAKSKSKTKTVSTNKVKCTCCTKEKNEKEFYKSNSLVYKGQGRLSICKTCLIEIYDVYLKLYENNEDLAVYYICRLLDVYFNNDLLSSVKEQAKNQGSSVIQIYFQKVNSLNQYSSLTFSDSLDFVNKSSTENRNIENEIVTVDDEKNKNDVLRMLNHDPFEFENPNDKRHLYNTLLDFLDESTLEDSFKLPAVIEIVKTFNQIDKINRALSIITEDITKISSNVGGIKSLIEAKDKMLRAILVIAKDNGISVNHNNNKSKGGNTLNGIVKKLNEIGLSSAEINLFDLETCESMKQIADFSNKSILDQLLLDENEYTDMIAQQKEMIAKLDENLIKTEEENRLLKIKINQLEKGL